LAPVVVDTVYDGLREINRNGTALVVVEQQVHRVLELATWAVVLDHGSVAYEGDPAGAGEAVESLMARREEAAASGAAEAVAEADAGEGHAHLRDHLHAPHFHRHDNDHDHGSGDEGAG
jgi:energy-coupling factor transporter ATP-binding protein EcfA2